MRDAMCNWPRFFARLRRQPGPTNSALSSVAEIRVTIERILTTNIVPFWYPQTLDREHGGYRLHHDRRGRWKGPAPKRAITQARTMWFFARLARSPYGNEGHLAAAAHGFELLRDRLWDERDGGFYWEVDATGRVATHTDKHVISQSYALYALVEYALTSGDASATELAQRTFALMEEYAPDPMHAGYIESFERDWTPTASARPTTMMGVPPSVKSLNAHLHILETYTRYLLLTGDELARQRLVELISLLSEAVVRPNGACTDQHQRDWTPLLAPATARVIYGHDLENVWLLMDAVDAIGESQARLLPIYERIVAYSLAYGGDREHGGFFASGPLGSAADRRLKIWWAQAEALVATLRMHRLTDDARYWESFTRTLDWVVRHQVDWRHGDWHADILPNGRVSGDKAGPWKSPYHNGRAMLCCLELLSREPLGTAVS
ncbi:MAG: AGE family epimerase/isomerase [Deltaproteobacteria bacterium]|nr:AGE family epimerase/isomerase [Deltaproteobacteria bacterium]MBI3387986.1 AGE family epimerase/isomerase [Deltaproteobacteria bacterium]